MPQFQVLDSPIIPQLLPKAAICMEHGSCRLDEILLQKDLANPVSRHSPLQLIQDILPARMRQDIHATTKSGELLRGCLFMMYFGLCMAR